MARCLLTNTKLLDTLKQSGDQQCASLTCVQPQVDLTAWKNAAQNIAHRTACLLIACKAHICLVTAAEFDLVVGDSTVMSALILAQILEVPLVEVMPLPLIPPLFEQQQSIPNPVAYLPQLGTFHTLDMVR